MFKCFSRTRIDSAGPSAFYFLPALATIKGMKLGRFITIEGIDGSGKSTIVKKVACALFDLDKRNHVVLTREPFISKYNKEIRHILKSAKSPNEDSAKLARLFVLDRRVHAKEIKKQLASGFHVLCDRYKFSTLAYQWAQGISLDLLLKMHKGVLTPDLTLVVDLPAKLALKRIGKDRGRAFHEVFEKEKFQETLRQNYLFLAKKLKRENVVIINGSRSPEAVFKDALKVILKNLPPVA